MNRLSRDIEQAAMVKLANAESQLLEFLTSPAARGALKGSLGLTAATMPIAALDAYANDENLLKNMAGAAKWTLPLGALGGAGMAHSGALVDKILSKIPSRGDLVSGAEEVYNKVSPKITEMFSSMPKPNVDLEELAAPIKGMAGSISTSSREVVDMIKDLLGSFKQ